MNLYRMGAVLIVVGLAGGFLYLERHLLSEQLTRHLIDPRPKRDVLAPLAALLAPPPHADANRRSDTGAIVFKRSLDEPDFRINPPLLDGLVSSSRLESLDNLVARPREESFPVPPSLRPAVDFWQLIYGEYDSDQMAVHDDIYLDRIYAVIDFDDLNDLELSDEEIADLRRERELEKLDEIDEVLAHLDDIEGTVESLTPLEGKIWQMWSFMADDPERFAKARERVRTQTGLSDAFTDAIARSGVYLTYMEDIFIDYGLPHELTRLVFVESMFVNSALSKTGAAGLWQFMPGTAKRYKMKINQWIDERLDPFIASHGAAQLLQANYEALGTWPLAINAYNSGAGRLKRAVRQLGTDDIGVITRHYKGRGYGFASRNFYPSFIAALEVAENYRQLFGDVPIADPITYEVVQLPDRARFQDVAEILELDLGSLQDLNPAFNQLAFESDVFLPTGAAIRVPLGEGARVMIGIYNTTRPSAPPARED